MDKDYLQLALGTFNTGKSQWYGWRKNYTGDKRMSYENLILNDNTATMPTEAEGKVEKALELPKPGTGTYTIDMGDPAATNTLPPTRMEFNMKDQMARNQIDAVIKEVDEMKEEIKLLRK